MAKHKTHFEEVKMEQSVLIQSKSYNGYTVFLYNLNMNYILNIKGKWSNNLILNKFKINHIRLHNSSFTYEQLQWND